MKSFYSAIFSIAVIFLMSFSAFAQETQEHVIDEVVAQVNDGVITLSRINREIKGAVDSLVQQGKTPEEAKKIIDDKRGELIANVINEELLLQKAKEKGMDSDIEANVNQRFAEIMKQQNVKTFEELYSQMQSNGINPDEIRELWRKQAAHEMVLQNEVQRKIYFNLSPKELKTYFDQNKDKFTKPETVTISDIFLSYAGRSEAEVYEKANKLVTQLRGGADFQKLMTENSDNPKTAEKSKPINVSDLTKETADAIKNVKTLGVSNPIEIDKVGIEILHVDDRSAASSESVFDENAVRLAITKERAPAEQKKYMSELRRDSYIKINENYRPLVAPILFADERKDDKPAK